MTTPLHPLHSDVQPPERFTYPFEYQPHPLCLQAAHEVQQELERMAASLGRPLEGKMFGVLVVDAPSDGSADGSGRLAFLAAYSGLLEERNDWPYFVPPVFDAQQPDGYFKQREREISAMVKSSDEGRLIGAKMSQDLQVWLFRQYQMLNARGSSRDLIRIWQDYYTSPRLRRRFPLPPGGSGDCCAPKLLQYAYKNNLRPRAMAEFWWGETSKSDVRHHGVFYPSCRGKCKPILTWMLRGLNVDPDPESLGFEKLDIKTIYEDEWILVIDKPSGLLSIPGRIEQHSVETIVRHRYPGSHVAHRLDMGTSGLLIVAKNLDAYRPLQEQFVRHEVKKKYVALLEEPTATSPHVAKSGTIRLPILSDPLNRPRQVIDHQRGKTAVTDYNLLDNNLIELWPHTGRTHQLRLHCAHPDGIGRPIVGDELYGKKGERLCLHAAEIEFHHPITRATLHFELPHPFGNQRPSTDK